MTLRTAGLCVIKVTSCTVELDEWGCKRSSASWEEFIWCYSLTFGRRKIRSGRNRRRNTYFFCLLNDFFYSGALFVFGFCVCGLVFGYRS